MTCEKAEDLLSAYLDDILAPQLRGEVADHIESCDQCRETLEDYRRFDLLIAAERRVEPSPELHDRIFDSSEFAAILAEQAKHERERVSPLRRRAGAGPGWARGALSAAAVAILVFGSALLIKQGLLHSGTTSGRTTPLIAGPTGVKPLAHGARVVYLRDGALWSAPAGGPGLAARLTPQGVGVGTWAVSPDGTSVAYADAASGYIHVVRSDDQDDVETGAVSITGPRAALVWSPNGQQIAYMARASSDAPALRIMNADGGNDRAVSTPAGAVVSAPVWSPDGLNLAFAADVSGAHGVYFYNLALKGDARLLAPADGADAAAAVAPAGLHWLPDMTQPSVTWAATDDSGATLTGVFAQSVLGSAPRRLTGDGLRLAADFSPARGGSWLVSAQGDTPQLTLISPASGASQPVASGTAYARVAWAPDGSAAALVSTDGRLALWTAAGGVSAVPGAAGVAGTPVWSPDGRVAALSGDGVVVVRVSGGAATTITTLTGAPGARSVAFAPSGSALAVALPTEVAVFADERAAPKLLDGTADAGVLAWSVAG